MDRGSQGASARGQSFARPGLPAACRGRRKGIHSRPQGGILHRSGRVLIQLDYDRLQGELAARRGRGEYVGLGIACFVEKSGLGPQDLVRIKVDGRGAVKIVTGVASVGQGVETALAQICAETMKVP